MGKSGMTLLRWVRIAAMLALFVASGALTLRAAVDWQIVRYEGRDYLSVESIAKFYGFPTAVPPASQIGPVSPQEPLTKKLTLDNGRQQIEITLNSREIMVNGVRQWLAFPVAVVDDKLVMSRLDLAKTIEPSLRPEMIADLKPIETVVLDAGHGGHDKGAVSIFGNEKDFALDTCLRAKKLLEAKGLKVLLTRDADVFIPLQERPVMANRIPNSIFVAVHFNDAIANPMASGFEIYSITPRGGPSTTDDFLTTRDLRNEPGNAVDVPSLALASSVYHSMVGNIPQVDRGIKHARFAVIRLATVPAVLIEGGFVSSSTEARQIATPAWRQKLAESIVSGIEGYKALAEHRVPPKVVADYRRSVPANMTAQAGPTVVTNAPSVEVVPPKTP
jgi:N-acetylmuramoyl-L-alanine amidase